MRNQARVTILIGNPDPAREGDFVGNSCPDTQSRSRRFVAAPLRITQKVVASARQRPILGGRAYLAECLPRSGWEREMAVTSGEGGEMARIPANALVAGGWASVRRPSGRIPGSEPPHALADGRVFWAGALHDVGGRFIAQCALPVEGQRVQTVAERPNFPAACAATPQQLREIVGGSH